MHVASNGEKTNSLAHFVLFSLFLYESFIPPSRLVLPSLSPRWLPAFSGRIPFRQLVSVSPCKHQRGDTKGAWRQNLVTLSVSTYRSHCIFFFYFFIFFLADELRLSQTAKSDEMKLLWGHAALSEVSVPINVINRSQWWLEPGKRRLIQSRTKAWLRRSPFWLDWGNGWLEGEWSHVGLKQKNKIKSGVRGGAYSCNSSFLFFFSFARFWRD